MDFRIYRAKFQHRSPDKIPKYTHFYSRDNFFWLRQQFELVTRNERCGTKQDVSPFPQFFANVHIMGYKPLPEVQYASLQRIGRRVKHPLFCAAYFMHVINVIQLYSTWLQPLADSHNTKLGLDIYIYIQIITIILNLV